MGILDNIHLPNFCNVTALGLGGARKRKRPLQTVEVEVLMDCDGCERRVRNAVCSLRGLLSVEVSRKQNRVTVTGYVNRNSVLRAVKSTGKKAEFWPYVPYSLVYYPYVPQAYDVKAPAGYVRNVPQAMINPGGFEETYTSLFSDDNPNACSIM